MDVVELTRQLVRIPSLNPMGRATSGPCYLEAQITDHLARIVDSLGLPCERQTVLPGRDNLICRLDGCGRRRDELILLEVHQDTVPIEGMTVDPFGGELIDGRIYGRGACDVKGGMAAMLCAVARLAATDAAHRPTVILAFTVNEEFGFDGVRHLRELWSSGRSMILPRRPDYAIVAEPTEMNVVVAHKGAVRWRLHTCGRAVHSSDPAAGVNAIYLMQPILACLQHYAEHELSSITSHPLVGCPTLSVGVIQGGLSVNTVPDRCTIEIDRRLIPGESAEAAIGQVRSFLDNRLPALKETSIHDLPFLVSPAMPADRNGWLGQRLAHVIQQHGGGGQCVGVPFGTDAGTIAEAGVPVVVFGPGSIQQAHTKDEWIAVDDLERAVPILTEFCSGTDRSIHV